MGKDSPGGESERGLTGVELHRCGEEGGTQNFGSACHPALRQILHTHACGMFLFPISAISRLSQ